MSHFLWWNINKGSSNLGDFIRLKGSDDIIKGIKFTCELFSENETCLKIWRDPQAGGYFGMHGDKVGTPIGFARWSYIGDFRDNTIWSVTIFDLDWVPLGVCPSEVVKNSKHDETAILKTAVELVARNHEKFPQLFYKPTNA